MTDAKGLSTAASTQRRDHLALAQAALVAGDRKTAIGHLDRVKQAPPTRPDALVLLGRLLIKVSDVDGAHEAFTRSAAIGSVDALCRLGEIELVRGRFAQAEASLRRALDLAPNAWTAHEAMGRFLETRHDLDGAQAHASRAIFLNPAAARARLTLAQIALRREQYQNAVAAAELVVASPTASTGFRSRAWGLIGDALDALGDHAGAFEAFSKSNQLILSQNADLMDDREQFFHPDRVREMLAVARTADPSRWRSPSSFAEPAPVFLVGFPRSGTTLLDQVLASHSQITCIEERPFLARAAFKPEITGPNRLDAIGSDEIRAVRRDYWMALRAEYGAAADAPVVVDKLPLNLVALPLIKRIFPDAKVLLALRDPRDVIVSCFQQRFGLNAAMVRFLQLETAAEYYDLVMSIAEACRERLDFELHEVRYENVVANLEQEAMRICGFLGLPFEASMLDYAATARNRNIITPSARQVVQPLYDRSVSRWRRYEAQLAPVLRTLNSWADRLGYGG
jgi:tetratricopeptide (TPR) repeat protein